jgi:hypothetical protein
MEPAGAVLLLKSQTLVDADVKIGILVGDADSSTAAAVRKEFGDTVKRALDITHTKKNFKNSLYKLKKQHSRLSSRLITYLANTVGTIIKKSAGDKEEIIKCFKNVPDHVFNKHDNCNIEWCRALQDPTDYKSKYINVALGPHGCPLYDGIVQCFNKLVGKADELSLAGSTLPNESFNMTAQSKALKVRHYSDSESLTHRIMAAVCQRNLGVTYTF